MPGFDRLSSSDAVALPESGHLFVRSNTATQRFVERSFLIIAQHVNTPATRFNFTRHLGEFILIFLRPVFNPTQNLSGSLSHESNIANGSLPGYHPASEDGFIPSQPVTARLWRPGAAVPLGRVVSYFASRNPSYAWCRRDLVLGGRLAPNRERRGPTDMISEEVRCV